MIRLGPLARLALVAALLAMPGLGSPTLSFAQGQQTGPETGLPLPRFVSLRSDQANVRFGPGADFEIKWTYVRRGLPVEIIEEFDNWRHIRDSEGNDGWVSASLLSSDRYAIVLGAADGEPLEVHASPDGDARITARLEAGVIASVERCQNAWCRLSDRRFTGWVEQGSLWGVYPGEEFN